MIHRRMIWGLTLFLAGLELAGAPLPNTQPVVPADAIKPLLVWDVAPALRDTLPRNFRTTDTVLKAQDASPPSALGLAGLHMAGGGQFTAAGLKLALGALHGPVTVFDLRQETHVFVAGLPVSWFATNNWANVGRAHPAIEADEASRVRAFVSGTKLELADDKTKKPPADATPPETLVVAQPATEREIVEAAGAAYVRITVADHARPTDEEVDRFLQAVKALPADGCVLFHCRAGRGRTTTFMALYDMLRNARQVTLEDIARRQEIIGNDFDVLQPADPGSAKAPYVADRIAFVRAFYDYARANPDGRPQLWSEWLAKRPAAK